MSGASRIADIDGEHLAALNSGQAQSRTLAEALAIDHAALLHSALPQPPAQLAEAAAAAQSLGIVKRMQAIGTALAQQLPAQLRDELAEHPSDTVRGWMCFAVAADAANGDVERLLDRIRPAADDQHFAVREWAWMAARPRLAAELDQSIALLVDWTESPSENHRRFASEALRPRGVWARHIPELADEPSRGLPLLEPLRADPARYVQNSVANWINDASKSRPDWAREVCQRWLRESPCPETAYIAKRALRSLS